MYFVRCWALCINMNSTTKKNDSLQQANFSSHQLQIKKEGFRKRTVRDTKKPDVQMNIRLYISVLKFYLYKLRGVTSPWNKVSGSLKNFTKSSASGLPL